ARKILVFALAQVGERIETPKLLVDMAGVAHENAALGQSFEKSRKQRGKVRRGIEIVDAGECRIGPEPFRRRAAAKATAETAQRRRLEVACQNPQRQRAPALAHPRGGRGAFDRGEYGVANLRKEMHMLMAVDEVGRAPECVRKRRKLGV